MSDDRPAWARESAVLRLGSGFDTVAVTPEWAFGGSTGAGVRVAVVDSGIDADHPMLGDCVDRDGSVDVSIADDGSILIEEGPHGDVFGHGTACAGIIHTLAPDSRITSVRVLGPSLTGKAAGFHAGLMWAVEQGFDVINLSLGTSKRDWALAFHDVCDSAYFGSSFVVTAANNVARPSYPSLFASVASVACNTSTDPLRFHANPEPPTEFLARGIDVEVPWTNGGMTTTTGNSFAAPHIAAFAALVKSKHPQLRPFQIKSVLWATAANVREATAPEPAGRRGTMYAGGARGTAMALVRSSAASPGSPATPASSERPGSPAVAPSGEAQTGSPAPRRRSPVEEVAGVQRVVDGIEIGDVVGRWRWGAIRAGRRVDDGQDVVMRELPSPAVLPELRDVIERAHVDHPHVAPRALLLADPPMLVTGAAAVSTDDTGGESASLAEAVAITAAVAGAHQLGLIHGDLGTEWLERPVGRQGQVAVGGFGVAPALAASSAGTATRLAVATMQRLAPEQLEDRPITAATDVWALALLWCEFVGGGSPWPPVDQVGALLRQRLSSPPRPTVELLPEVPVALTAVLDRALAMDPDARPPDAVTFLAAVTQALDGVDGVDGVDAAVGRTSHDDSRSTETDDQLDSVPRRRRWRR